MFTVETSSDALRRSRFRWRLLVPGKAARGGAGPGARVGETRPGAASPTIREPFRWRVAQSPAVRWPRPAPRWRSCAQKEGCRRWRPAIWVRAQSRAGLTITTHTHHGRLLFLGMIPFLPLIALSGPDNAAATDGTVTTLDPVFVEASAANPWQYISLPGFEIISRCPDSTTHTHHGRLLFLGMIPFLPLIALSGPDNA